MNRVWLICALAALCAGCVARKDEAANAIPVQRTKTPERPPLPLFHADYKVGSPWHEYNENTEANLRRFANLVATTVRVRARRGDFASEREPWIDVTEMLDLSEVRWAFSGELMETRSPGMRVSPAEFKFDLSDGTSIEVLDWGDYYSVDFPGASWSMIRRTDRMRAALEPAFKRLYGES
jgi:hypothetical protein